jgi:hypothetical protein
LFPRPTSLFVVSALAGLAACGGDNLLLPKDGEPARIAIVRGDNQTGTVGQALGDSLVVKVTDPSDRPVVGVEVVFVPPLGADVSPNDTVQTGPDGQAAVHYTLSTTAGEQIVEAHAPIVPSTNSTATFRASAEPEGAVALLGDGGDGQSGQVATVLPESLAVRAVDRFGNGVAGVEVTWDAGGGGELSPGSAVTGADGRAAAQLTLGDEPGSSTITAGAGELEGSPVSFTVMAVAAPKPELVLVTQPSATAAAGVRLEQQPELQLRDPFGAPLNRKDVNVSVQIASGGGSLGGKTSVKSDASGRVKFTDLSIEGETGDRTLIFAAEGFTPATSGVIAVGSGPPAVAKSTARVLDGTAGATSTITVRLEDEFGNPASGSAGAISITVDGANPSASLPVTETGNGSYSASYVPIHSGTDLVNVRVKGSAIPGSPFQSTIVPGPAAASGTTAQLTTTCCWFFFYYRIEILVTARDAQGNAVGKGGDQVAVAVDGGAVAPPPVVDNGDGTYSAFFYSLSPTHSVAITLNGAPIQGSPYTTP